METIPFLPPNHPTQAQLAGNDNSRAATPGLAPIPKDGETIWFDGFSNGIKPSRTSPFEDIKRLGAAGDDDDNEEGGTANLLRF